LNLKQRKLVTIVAEAALEPRLIRDLTNLGAKGYTITPALDLAISEMVTSKAAT
jgi:hypothetical protein